jgi:alkanesulfonate monooxygenase SsuD/methylene tetrahydromethanopterin reductase-like flavin-dependent oxidoreductase (luciferase family)
MRSIDERTPVNFSMIFEAQLANPTREREHQLLRDCVEQAVFAESMGFDRIWAVEHHALKWYAHMSAPEIFLATVAARTSRIRIGHGVVCMAFNYNFPTRVAERAAMLDVLSNGRVDLGAGRGGTTQEMSLCNVDPDRTTDEVEESLRILSAIWTNETFEWHGDLLTIESPEGNSPHTVVPRPVQEPHPPLYLACTRPETLQRAADYGVGALAFGFAGPESVRMQRRVYDEALAARTGDKFVSTVTNDYFAALCPTIVLDDAGAAREIGARAQRFLGESINHWARGTPAPAEFTEDDDNVAVMAQNLRELEMRVERGELAEQELSLAAATFNIDHAYGTYETAIEYVHALEDAGADEVMCFMQMGTVPNEVCIETIRQWGQHVIPHFRAGSEADGRTPSIAGNQS